MILKIRQMAKELFEATFVIEADGRTVGDMKLVGSLGSMEGVWSIRYAGLSVRMTHGKVQLPAGEKPFRPYDIYVNDQPTGSVFQTDVKEGGLFSKYPVSKIYFNGACCTLYPICFGEEGAKSPVYFQNTQIAEVHKSAVIENELHHFNMYIKDERFATACVLLCCYSYVLGFFRPGEKPIMSVRKIICTEKNKHLLAKYDPGFMASFQ
ncbi:MAG: hypothetical protein K5695_09565 [Oscillospiraceae bacterium]|nr:hypothetical protein [Oscillospiraceae bacterium]